MKEKASSGLGYLAGKLFYRNESSSSDYEDRYSSRSSSSYNPPEVEEDGSYVKMNDNKKENLLEKDFKNY